MTTLYTVDINNTINIPYPYEEEDDISTSPSTSSNISTKSILKNSSPYFDELNHQHSLKMAKMVTNLGLIIIQLPIVIFNVYFAYNTRSSCVSVLEPLIGLSLHDYLVGQAYVIAFTLALRVPYDIYDLEKVPICQLIFDMYKMCYRIFALFWVSFGIMLISFVTTNNLCSNEYVYFYTIVTIIITLSFIGMSIIVHIQNTLNSKE
jgi:hypothetical protein